MRGLERRKRKGTKNERGGTWAGYRAPEQTAPVIYQEYPRLLCDRGRDLFKLPDLHRERNAAELLAGLKTAIAKNAAIITAKKNDTRLHVVALNIIAEFALRYQKQ